MKALLAEKNIPLTIVIFPVTNQVNNMYRNMNLEYVLYPQKRIKQICEMNEIPYLDLTDAIYENGGIDLYRDYLHLNAKGNDVVANELEKYLVGEIKILNANLN